MVDEDLLRQREGAAQTAAADTEVFIQGGVDALDQFDGGGGGDGHRELAFLDRWSGIVGSDGNGAGNDHISIDVPDATCGAVAVERRRIRRRSEV